MEELQRTAFEIIASVGEAKTYYMNAVKLAKEGNITEARETIGQGNEVFCKRRMNIIFPVSREKRKGNSCRSRFCLFTRKTSCCPQKL